ncbi:HAD family hydrolase [Evansella cellulosilytica]|uniref:HAD-superfamily hydrolase, subfamily IA, variant 1 n=1 Tax=Evansella cellulosilytica (strain ATCC 21833 / DSM 2522 / FERM P-1141 / JCM 9156 / N-4) TaxID=649639 RepID=E6TWP8_EVAC2|nr:HAD-IA family hydrolase [Evansella cellulosilytica]ADU28731.1 HAD-superfamily hydrolase, subfamily IA, variant 1 [Evansella cellulosilytica DSM 2522]
MMKAVLFDLDNTLLDRDASVRSFVSHQYDRLSNYLNHIPKETYINRFIHIEQRGYVWKDIVYQQLVEEFIIREISSDELLQDYIMEFRNHCIPFPNLNAMLDSLKESQLLLGIITNGKGKFQMDNIKALKIEDYFDLILISEWENLKKPDPRIFQRALEQLNVRAKSSFFVGDHPQNDIDGAHRVNMKTIWKRDHQWCDVHADFIIDDLIEIPAIIHKDNISQI